MKRKILCLTIFAYCFLFVVAAQSQEVAESIYGEVASPPGEGSAEARGIPQQLSLGLAGFYKSGLYVDRDDTWIPVPLVYYRQDNFSVYVKRATYTLFKQGNVELAALGDLRLDGYEGDDSDYLEGMKDRHYSVDGGFALEVDTAIGDITLEGVTDLFFQSQGQEARLAYEIPLIFGNWYIKPIFSGRWKSKKLANYYYGVRENEATSLRPEYVVKDTYSLAGQLALNYRIADNWLMIFLAEYQWFSSKVKDSPIVDDSGQLMAFWGVGWVF